MLSNRPLILLLMLPILLTACQTINRVGDRLATMTGETDLTGGERVTVIPQGACPAVSRVAELASLYQFADPTRPRDQEKISEAHITKVASKCATVGKNLKLDLAVSFDSGLGPRGRVRAGDKPSFAYPYFVAIMDAQNKILAKEIFAVSFGYGTTGNIQMQIETQSQLVPLTGADPSSYRIMIGFQLSPEELAYNRKLPLEELGKTLTINAAIPTPTTVLDPR